MKNIRVFAGAIVCTIAIIMLCMTGCGDGSQEDDSNETRVTTGTLNLIEDAEFGNVFADISNEELMACGFELGDSVDVIFTEGKTLKDIPVFDGYYTRTGDMVVCCYPTYEHVCIARTSAGGILDIAGTTVDDTVEIVLNEAGKYKMVQDALGMTYSNDRKDYDSDSAFANFRELSGGDIVPKRFYRGATPFDSQANRPPIVQALLKKNNIQFIFDMADDEEKYKEHLKTNEGTEYTDSLMAQGKVLLLGMSASYQSDEYCQKLAQGLVKLTEAEGPYYIHCTEGKDRTGFACVIIESLAGATYDEMKKDYMKSYDNYYRVNPKENKTSYEAIVSIKFDDFMSYLHGTENIDELKEADYSEDARAYLEKGGMTEEQIDNLVKRITEQ